LIIEGHKTIFFTEGRGCVESDPKPYVVHALSEEDRRRKDFEQQSGLASREFAQTDEAVVAAILDELGIRWQYEAITVMEYDRCGRRIRGATSDFYLPDYNLFLDVKSSPVANERQKEIVIRAGYGFAYIVGILWVAAAKRVALVQEAIFEARGSLRLPRLPKKKRRSEKVEVEKNFNLRLEIRRVLA
jgi:hypothetical protein